MNRSAYKQYNQTKIKTANKGKLIVMLYQAALKAMKKALLLLEKKDMEGKGEQLIKAQDIILELMYALDPQMVDSGNELAVNLQRLYLYSYRRLVHANINLEPAPINEVIVLLNNLLGAWEEVVASEAGRELQTPVGANMLAAG